MVGLAAVGCVEVEVTVMGEFRRRQQIAPQHRTPTMNTPQLLYPDPPTDRATEGHCAVCGWHGLTYAKAEVFSKSTGAVSVLATVPSDRLCIHCTALWGGPKVWHRAILATPEAVQFPTIAPDPEGKRPTWGQALAALDPELPRACILTTDPKKRVWPFAQVSQGDRLSMYLHDPSRGISGNRVLSLDGMLNTLASLEDIYALGFSKQAIERGLLGDLKRAQALGIPATVAHEGHLQSVRTTPEFLPALIIAQKES